MEDSGMSLHELKGKMEKYPQQMINVKCQRGTSIESVQPVSNAVKATEEKLKGKGRVLLRASGTEPVVRVMVEGEDESLVEELVRDLAKAVEQALS
jgi:phosphoglucosamine mutase